MKYWLCAFLLTINEMTLAASTQTPQNDNTILIQTHPPLRRYEVIPAPLPGYVWSAGYWDWNGERHVWARGHWEKIRNGYVYQQPKWRPQGKNWKLERGNWQILERAPELPQR